MSKYLIGLLSGAVLLSACTKHQIDEIPQSNDPVFKVEGLFGNESFDLIAGDDGAYMYTGTMNVNNVNLFYGNLNDGNISIELGIFDGLIDMTGVDPAQNITSTTPVFAYQSGEPLVVLTNSMIADPQTVQTIKWHLNGSFVGFDNIEIMEPGWYNVLCEVTFNDSSTAILENDIIVGYERTNNFDVIVDMGFNNMFNATIDVINSPAGTIQNVVWSFNGVQIGSTSNIYQYQLNNEGILSAEVTFASGVTRVKNVYINPNPLKKIEDLSMMEEMSSNFMKQDFNVRLIMIKDGVTYSSVLADNASSTITITGFEYYGLNANSKKVYKITAIVNAKVKTAGSTTQIPVSFTTTFGVEIQ